MASTTHNLVEPYTVLNDRVLWFDGDSSYTTEALGNKILNGSTDWMNDYVIDPDDFSVKRLNQLDDVIQLTNKDSINIPDDSLDWQIPDKYLNLNVKEYVYLKLRDEFNKRNFSLYDEDLRIDRVTHEFTLWNDIRMFDLLKVLVYIVDMFMSNDIVWGTGRGSSCCSYILYLIGVHDVDSVKYDLETTDFFRT